MAEQTNLRRVVTTTQSNVVVPALLALVFGLFLLLGSGFAGSETLHNAAHDSRHS
ncbi:MAG: CbtB-domain containing protein, partial [Pseudomonadota bacterium]|nr:CbtB-domain containing protein [Pseudomonadota bacterium]